MTFDQFTKNEINRSLHCHGKLICVVSHLFSKTLTLGLWIKVIKRFHTWLALGNLKALGLK
jgi:hypothetical protein